MIFILWQNSWCHGNVMAVRFDLLKTHWEPSRAPRNSKFGTDFRKNPLCSYTKIRIASCKNREVIGGGAGVNSTETDYTYVYSFFYLCLLLFTRVYQCLPLFTRACLPMFTNVNLYWPMFTLDYLSLLVLTYVYPSLPMFTSD